MGNNLIPFSSSSRALEKGQERRHRVMLALFQRQQGKVGGKVEENLITKMCH